jgi:hypothetical protein
MRGAMHDPTPLLEDRIVGCVANLMAAGAALAALVLAGYLLFRQAGGTD